jgi:hypothetical protein
MNKANEPVSTFCCRRRPPLNECLLLEERLSKNSRLPDGADYSFCSNMALVGIQALLKKAEN